MNTDELGLSGDPEPLIESLARQKDALREHGHGGHGGPIETVRESTYRGHDIVVRTTYSIAVDGKPIEGHLGVSNDGQVHYHPIPNLGFASAIELVEKLIDAFPDDFGDPPGYGGDEPGGGEDPHGGGGEDPHGGGGEHPHAGGGEDPHAGGGEDPPAHDHASHDHGDR